MAFDTPMRYPGGKGRLARFMRDVIDRNGLGSCYIEPYAGGAGIAISLLLSRVVERVQINDLNRSVFSFWSAVRNDSDELCRRIESAKLDMTEWHRQKAVQHAENPDPSDLAFSTLYLNRTNRSGILSGGVIGGQAQAGDWKLDARFKKAELILRIERIQAEADRIEVFNLDAELFLRTRLCTVPEASLIYLDPPYYVKGQGLYENHYVHDDHERIAGEVSALKHPWIVSYDDVEPIRQLYRGFRQRKFSLHYSAQRRCAGHEVMVLSKGLKAPKEIAPSRAGIVRRAISGVASSSD